MHRRSAEKVLSYATALRVDAADVFIRSSSSSTVEVKDRNVDAFDHANDVGLGVRVIVGNRLGFAFTTDLSDSSLRAVANNAFINARSTELDYYQSIPALQTPSKVVAIHDPGLALVPEKEKIERVLAMEREAFELDPRIKHIRKASARFSNSETIIFNTRGAKVSYQSTACSASIEVVAEEKDESQAGSEFDISRLYGKLEIEKLGRKAAQRAIDLLGARHIDSIRAPVLLENTIAQDFLSLLAGGFSSENVQKKRSLFIGKLGMEIVSSPITVIDDGLLDGGFGTAPADDEAVPLKKKTLIEQGRLVKLLYNTYTANKDKTESTGNGMRGGFKGLPGVGVTNLYIEPGTASLDELIVSVDRGLMVTEVMGMHTADSISGDFSVGAMGFWIEKGKKAYPVREVTIAGNILDLMKLVRVVGKDLRFSGRIGSPSLLIEELSVGGK